MAEIREQEWTPTRSQVDGIRRQRDGLIEQVSRLEAEIIRLRGGQSAVRDMAESEADDLREEIAARDRRIAEMEEALRDVVTAYGPMYKDLDGPAAVLIFERSIKKARALLPATGKEAEHDRE